MALRAVDDDGGLEPSRPIKRKTLKEAAESGERDLLVAMRHRIMSEIDAGPAAHTIAPLMRQLREIDKEIRALDARSQQERNDGGHSADTSYNPEVI